MLMAHRGLDWHYHMPWDFFGKAWDEAKPEVAFGELPVLVIDGTHMLWENAAILRYLADGTPLVLSDARARARADAILDSTKRFVMPVDATVNIRQGNRFEEEKAEALKKNARNAGAVPSRAGAIRRPILSWRVANNMRLRVLPSSRHDVAFGHSTL